MNNVSKSILGILVLVVFVSGAFWFKSYIDARSIQSAPDVFERNFDLAKESDLSDGVYTVDLGNSEIRWSASKILVPGYTDTGLISLGSGEFRVSNRVLTQGDFSIDMNSLEAVTTGSGRGQSGLTNHLKSSDFFDVEKFPVSEFKLKSFAPLEEQNIYLVTGYLTIKGITNEIVFEAEIFKIEGTASLKVLAKTQLDRTLWDIRFGSGKFFDNLGDNVIDDLFQVELDLVAINNQ